MKTVDKIFQRFNRTAKTLIYGDFREQTPQEFTPLSSPELSEIKRIFPLPKFFVLGHARSGTTLLARLLRLHPEVHCNWQAHFFTRKPFLEDIIDPEIRRWLNTESNRWNRGNDLSIPVMRAISDFIMEREALALGKKIVGDKSPNNLVGGEAVQRMSLVYPDAKLIFIVRDGRDTVLSHRFQSFIDFPEFLSREGRVIRNAFVNSPEPFLSGEKSLFSKGSLYEAAAEWSQVVQETDKMAGELYGDRYISLKYEDLIDHPYLLMKDIWNFLRADPNLPELSRAVDEEMDRNPDARWQREKAGALLESVEKGKMGGWKELFTDQDRQLFIGTAGDTLKRWGYLQENNRPEEKRNL